jgi:hypothetical protein
MRSGVTIAILVMGLTSATLAQTVPATTVTYDSRACQPTYDTFPFCNTSLPLALRVADLVGRLQEAEVRVGMVSFTDPWDTFSDPRSRQSTGVTQSLPPLPRPPSSSWAAFSRLPTVCVHVRACVCVCQCRPCPS